jgi:hypothetical protein
MKHLALVFLLFCSLGAVAQQRPTLKTLFYDQTEFEAKGVSLSIGPTVTYGQHLSADDIITSPVYSSGTYKARPRVGWNAEFDKYWINQKLIFFNRFDLGIHYVRFNGSEHFSGQDIFGGNLTEKRIFHENRVGLNFSGMNIYPLTKRSWIQNKVGVVGDYAYKRSTTGEYYSLPRSYSEQFRAQLIYGIGYGRVLSDGLFASFEVEVPFMQVYPGALVDMRMHYFHSHYYPIVGKITLHWAKHKPIRECDKVRPGPDASPENGGKHKKSDLFGPEQKKKKKLFH